MTVKIRVQSCAGIVKKMNVVERHIHMAGPPFLNGFLHI